MTDIYEYGFFQRLCSRLRKSPVKEIRLCLAVAREQGIEISALELEAHHLAGVRIGELMDALVLAKKEGVPATTNQLAAICLASRQLNTDVIGAVKACTGPLRELEFQTLGKDSNAPIEGTCRDGTRVRARCTVVYQLHISHVFGDRTGLLQERLAARIASLIFEADDFMQLKIKDVKSAAELLELAQTLISTVKQVNVSFAVA